MKRGDTYRARADLNISKSEWDGNIESRGSEGVVARISISLTSTSVGAEREKKPTKICNCRKSPNPVSEDRPWKAAQVSFWKDVVTIFVDGKLFSIFFTSYFILFYFNFQFPPKSADLVVSEGLFVRGQETHHPGRSWNFVFVGGGGASTHVKSHGLSFKTQLQCDTE